MPGLCFLGNAASSHRNLPVQTSEQTVHERAAAAEVSNKQLAQEAQELQASRDAAVALHQQLEQELQQFRHLAEVRFCAI